MSKPRRIMGSPVWAIPALIFASPLFAPQLLAFPHSAETELGNVRSDVPLDPEMLDRVTARANALVSASPLAASSERRPIFVTRGGWRWYWLANLSQGSFAITRRVTKAVVINHTDPVSGIVRNGRAIGGERTLSGVLAHEFTHGMIRRRYGIVGSAMLPDWKVEGYCDYVAQESSLSDDQARQLANEGQYHPALSYYEGRRRAADTLAQNGGSVDALFQTDK
ncbi:hypothetical protein [Qipengyuania marisflavi]|uniref:Uncharacterized protein n=1 Tax=Qipengyuania marisflavi TaxID=2486356 RepID=A0A5S3P9J0_9SPHN|nr:hypothetical protein [Qipengyuania marisflavi]TMM50164.1 hypothetical protein FEV51_02960 [Qipengyuania marisflavi]